MIDQRRAEREVVGMRARTHADLSFHFRAGEILVVLDIRRIHCRLVENNHPGAGGEGKPVRRTQVRRNALFQQFRFHRREQAEGIGLRQAGRVHRDEHVGRAVGALVLDTLEQLIFLALDAVDLDTGLAGEVRIQRLVGLVMARRIEIEHFLLGGGGAADHGQKRK